MMRAGSGSLRATTTAIVTSPPPRRRDPHRCHVRHGSALAGRRYRRASARAA
jgi:hypothetical protein